MQAEESDARSLGLFVRLPEKSRGQDAPLLFGLDELAAAVPVRDGLRDELPPRSVALLQPHRGAPRLRQYAFQRHLVTRPFGIGEPFLESSVVIEPADAIALLQRGFGFALAAEGDDLGAVLFGHVLVVEGALDAADLLV